MNIFIILFLFILYIVCLLFTVYRIIIDNSRPKDIITGIIFAIVLCPIFMIVYLIDFVYRDVKRRFNKH